MGSITVSTFKRTTFALLGRDAMGCASWASARRALRRSLWQHYSDLVTKRTHTAHILLGLGVVSVIISSCPTVSLPNSSGTHAPIATTTVIVPKNIVADPT